MNLVFPADGCASKGMQGSCFVLTHNLHNDMDVDFEKDCSPSSCCTFFSLSEECILFSSPGGPVLEDLVQRELCILSVRHSKFCRKLISFWQSAFGSSEGILVSDPRSLLTWKGALLPSLPYLSVHADLTALACSTSGEHRSSCRVLLLLVSVHCSRQIPLDSFRVAVVYRTDLMACSELKKIGSHEDMLTRVASLFSIV